MLQQYVSALINISYLITSILQLRLKAFILNTGSMTSLQNIQKIVDKRPLVMVKLLRRSLIKNIAGSTCRKKE